MLQFALVTTKQTVYSIQYGYSRWNNSSSNEYQYESNDGRSEASYAQSSRIQSLRLGIGKRTGFQKLILSSMIYLPLQVEYKSTYRQAHKGYDNANVLIYEGSSITTSPATFYSGLYLGQSAYYPVLKNLYIGAEFNLGIKLFYRNGIKTENTVNKDVNGETYKDVRINEKMFRTSLDFLPALSVKYQFGCCKKK